MHDIAPIHLTEPAHLRDQTGFTPPVYRYRPPSELHELIRGFWVPVWDLPPGRTTLQRVLQYPVGQLVIADSYARLVGPARGLGRQELAGQGWAVGTMLQPATASLLLDGPATVIVDGWVELDSLPGISGSDLTATVREQLLPNPADPRGHLAALDAVCTALTHLLPIGEEDRLVNRIIDLVEADASVMRVDQLTERLDIGERRLQRLVLRRTGISPKWLIQRRRLHEAAGRLAAGAVDLATLAVELGYTDQAHLTRDFKRVTGTTPGAFAAEPR